MEQWGVFLKINLSSVNTVVVTIKVNMVQQYKYFIAVKNNNFNFFFLCLCRNINMFSDASCSKSNTELNI